MQLVPGVGTTNANASKISAAFCPKGLQNFGPILVNFLSPEIAAVGPRCRDNQCSLSQVSGQPMQTPQVSGLPIQDDKENFCSILS